MLQESLFPLDFSDWVAGVVVTEKSIDILGVVYVVFEHLCVLVELSVYDTPDRRQNIQESDYKCDPLQTVGELIFGIIYQLVDLLDKENAGDSPNY